MAYNFVTVTGKYQDGSGNAAVGIVEFAPSGPIVDLTNKLTISLPVPLTTLAAATGSFSVSVLAMDNSGLSAFTWIFRPHIAGVPVDDQYLSILFSNGATQDITAIPAASNPF